MNRTLLFSTGALAVMAGATIVAVDAASAAGHAASPTVHAHSLKLKGTTLQQKELGKSHEVETDVLTKAGKTVGYTTASCDFGGTADKCAVTLALKGGVLLGHYTFPITNSNNPTTARGKITGGLGTYAGATGRIKLVTDGKHGRYTIKYS